MHPHIRSYLRDERGNIAIMSAIFFTVIMGVSALGVDLGNTFTDRRKAQGATDLAAMAAVNDLTSATKAAAATVQRNNFASDTPMTVELGTYTADPAVPAANRFKPSAASGANAARVTLQTTSKLFFGKALTGKETFSIQTKAIATQSAFAAFAIGSRLAKVDGGLLNQMLGGMLGSSLSLSAMDYQALIDAKLDMFTFLNALATRANLSGPTYDSVLKSNVKVSNVLDAMADTGKAAYGNTSAPARALSTIAQSVSGSSDKIKMASALDVGPYKALPLGQKPKVGMSASAFDMVSGTAQIANGQHQVEAALSVNVPGITSATLKFSVGERPVGTSWVTVGAAGASVYTAQTRILLTVQVAGSGSIASVSLPIYIDIASGMAKLNAVSCGYPNVNTSTVTLGVTPGVIDAWIGDVSNSQFNNFKSPPNPPAATLVSTPLLNATGRAHATMTNLSAQSVTFNYSEIGQQTKKTVSTKDFTSSLLTRLIGDLQLNVNVLGLGIGLPSVATSQISSILGNAVSPIDQLLSSVLATLGVGLGQADVWVLGVRCDGAVLVN